MYHNLLKSTICTFILFLLISTSLLAQNRDAAKNLHKKAVEFYHIQDYSKTIIYSVKAITKDSLFADPYILLANMYQDRNEISSAKVAYHKGFALDSIRFASAILTVAELELDSERFGKAVECARRFLNMKNIPPESIQKANNIIASAKFRQQAFMDPMEMEKTKLVYESDQSDEYINGITLDGQSILYTQKMKIGIDDAGQDIFTEKIYQADVKGISLINISEFELPEEMNERVGAASFSVDGRYLFFTACHEGSGNCELYLMSLKSPDKKVFNLGRNVNSIEWDSQPCFSADGKTLYFASKREGGFGGSDIWFSTLKDDGLFSRPKNAGANINTSEDEMAPFIHPDNRSLYFSSKGHPGMGGFDLFVSKKDSLGNWEHAINMGYPLNTSVDEINIIIAADGVNAYLSAKENDFDIYHFILKKNNPNPVINIVGFVRDAENNSPLFAKIELTELSSNIIFANARSFALDGFFTIPLPLYESFAFHVKKEGYLFYSGNFNVTDFAKEMDTLKVLLFPIRLNEKVSLNNVFFETDKYDLRADSKVELELMIKFMEENTNLIIEIGGHTDNVGTTEYNQTLSENRAKAVYDYLFENGIPTERLSYKGYGETELISSDETKNGRAANRRTEFKITGLIE